MTACKQLLTQKAFTLLEVLVATAIFAICIALVYSLYSSVTAVVTSVEEQMSRDLAAKTIMDRLSEDLSLVHVDEEGYLAFQPLSAFDQEEPFLELITAAHLQLDPEAVPVDVARVRYYLKKNDRSDFYRLLRSDTQVVGNPQINVLPEKQRHLLSGEVLNLELSARGQDGDEYDEWNSAENFEEEQELYVRFPRSFKMILTLGTDGNIGTETTYQKRVTVFEKFIEFVSE